MHDHNSLYTCHPNTELWHCLRSGVWGSKSVGSNWDDTVGFSITDSNSYSDPSADSDASTAPHTDSYAHTNTYACADSPAIRWIADAAVECTGFCFTGAPDRMGIL
jgi:hypothetical protein